MSREHILNGVYVSESGTRDHILTGVYVSETVSTAVVTTPQGWLGQLSQAPRIVALPLAVALTWCPQPITQAVAATPSLGWQAPLSAAQPVASVARSFSYVPLNPPAVISLAWQGPLSSALPIAKAPQAFAYVPFNTVQPSNSLLRLAWQQPLSKAAPQPPVWQGYSSVPFNTVQPAVAVTLTTGWQPPLSTAPKLASVPYSQPQLVPLANPLVSLGWYQPLSVAVMAVVRPRNDLSFVVPPFVVPSGWQSALSVAPSVAKTSAGFGSVPFATPQVVSLAWQQPLSIAPPRPAASQSLAFVPFDTAQVAPSTIAGMAWCTPLSVAPTLQKVSAWTGPPVVFAPVSGSITVKRQPTLFMSNIGRMMN